jgi:hypothetical protein
MLGKSSFDYIRCHKVRFRHSVFYNERDESYWGFHNYPFMIVARFFLMSTI